MNSITALNYLNYNSNLFNLRDKITRDLSLKNHLYDIQHRKYQRGGSYCLYIQKPLFSSTMSSASNRKTSTKKSIGGFPKKTKSLQETLRSSKMNFYRLQTEARENDNSIFHKRLNRISSPLSRKKLNTSYTQIQKYKDICRRVKPLQQEDQRHINILYKLPKIYIR